MGLLSRALDAFVSPRANLPSTRRSVALASSPPKDVPKDLDGLLGELDDKFEYSGRMEAKTGQDFRCGFVSIIGVSACWNGRMIRCGQNVGLISRLIHPLLSLHD
jgi:hypothetical protein